MVDENKIPIFNSEEFADKIADKVYIKIAKPFADFMENIKDGQEGIAKSLNQINKRLELTEEKVRKEEVMLLDHEKRLKEKKSRILKLEEGYEKSKRVIRIIDKLEPTLLRIDNASKWWKIVLYIIALAVLVFAAVAYSYRKGLLGQYKNSSIEMIDADIKTGKILPYTRAIHENRLSDTQIDTVQAGILKYNIKPVTITYDKR